MTVIIAATASKRSYRDDLKAKVERFVEVYVRCDPAKWLGQGTLDPSMRTMTSRCYRQLEEKGLVERCDSRGGGHTTHLKLTPAGEALAKQILAQMEPAAT